MNRLCSRVSLLLMMFLILWAGSAFAETLDIDGQRYVRQELRLNQFETSAQAHVVLDRGESGEYLVVWDSRRQEDGSYGVYARGVDPLGRRLGDELGVNLYQRSHQMSPALAMAGDEAFLVWESFGQDGSGQAVLGRAWDSDEILMAQETAGEQVQPVCAVVDDRRLAVWVSPGESLGSTRLAARLFDGSGKALGPEFAVAERSDLRDRHPALAAADGSFVLSWTRFDEEENLIGVMARRLDVDGAPLGEVILAAPRGLESSVDCAADGGFALAWIRPENETMRLEARRYDASGNPAGNVFSPGAAMAGWQNGAAVAMNAAGELALAWNQFTPGDDDPDIYARLYDADGGSRGEVFRVNAAGEGWQGLTAVDGGRRLHLGDDGRLALAWHGNSDNGDKSAANLSLFIPEPAGFGAKLLMKTRLALSGLAERFGRSDGPAQFASQSAMPHQPPVFDADFISGSVDPEPYFPGSSNRDEGWEAITNTGWNPPDPHCAVGPAHVMVTVNGGLAAFTKDGDMLWFEDIDNGFWAEVGGDGFVFDPEVLYDPLEDRFMAMANERDNGSYFLLGISSTSDPTDPWYKYRFNVTSEANGTDIDSPNFAVDEQAVYLTADFFGPDKYLVYIVDKSSVINGGIASTSHYLMTGRQSLGIPVQYDDAPNMYMIWAHETSSANEVVLYAIEDPLGSPSLVSYELSVPTYWDPPNARSEGTGQTITTFEARFWSCVYRNGSLWACHHIRPGSGIDKCAARWYEIEMNGWPDGGTPSLRQWGEELPDNNGYATFNSITVNQWGDAAMCFAYSSTSNRLTMTRVSRKASDPLGTMNDVVFVKESSSAYTGSRWGDYSAAVVDPLDDTRFWMVHEYALSGSNWSTWVSNFAYDLTAAPPVASAWPLSAREAFPNPSRGSTHLGFAMTRRGMVDVEIYDVEGRLVRRLGGGDYGAGDHELIWDGRNATGHPVVAGRYLSRISVDGETVPGHRITLVR